MGTSSNTTLASITRFPNIVPTTMRGTSASHLLNSSSRAPLQSVTKSGSIVAEVTKTGIIMVIK